MNFTLIVATLGRSDEIRRLFDSLLMQSYKEFDVIIVDQNSDNRVFKIYNEYKNRMSIQYIHTNEKGLSHARNLGMKQKLNDIVAFPDDDCWYAVSTLKEVNEIFTHSSYDVVSGQPLDPDGNLLVRNYLKNSSKIGFNNVWNAAISISIFIKKNVIVKVGFFDEKLGVGSGTIYGSGEETDYISRVLNCNFNVQYDTRVKIIHPKEVGSKDDKEIDKAFLYGCGMGYVLAKHHFPLFTKLKALIRPFGGACLAFAMHDSHLSRIRYNTFCGRLQGMRAKF